VVIGIGVDVIETGRVSQALTRSGSRFVERVYSCAELAECAGRADRAAALSGRFAAKEACLKALGTGFRGMSLREVEVVRDRDSGAPILSLSGRAAAEAERRGVRRLHVSITHQAGVAAAMVILEG
jgi:holo-[acyl-carrier protein] synthase